ncbi:GntR family transcriptional regulator [Paracoccus cavernae]|uniref:GntR family transcriptional regulator n=1 Tax=Paracoccus cavernae TaxID=1571207 RepID=A0ABT8DA31_9RHOB|nr:GntR family transcriptional regulator [Paracoccus cavernae]
MTAGSAPRGGGAGGKKCSTSPQPVAITGRLQTRSWLSSPIRACPGERLPSERDMAEQFSLSRPSLREALIALEVEGHVEIRMGSGIYLSHQAPGESRPIEGGAPFEILQARCIIESAVAEEAARHVSAKLIEGSTAT